MIKDGDLRFLDSVVHELPQFLRIARPALLRSLFRGGGRGRRGGEADAVALLRYPGLLLPGALPCHAVR